MGDRRTTLKVLEDFTAETESELTIKAGDLVVRAHESEQSKQAFDDGWLLVTDITGEISFTCIYIYIDRYVYIYI